MNPDMLQIYHAEWIVVFTDDQDEGPIQTELNRNQLNGPFDSNKGAYPHGAS